ncbi:MAG: hypothetical protein JNJ60_21460 [Rhodocyclaceae bacterium]|nr:hypothetical protein [Rhodocyclaceae bacterium]
MQAMICGIGFDIVQAMECCMGAQLMAIATALAHRAELVTAEQYAAERHGYPEKFWSG